MKESPKEISLQKKVYRFISDPSKVFSTTSGKRLQILSPGQLNRNEGPDFLDTALLLNGTILICDAEFHSKASDWDLHQHLQNPNYRNVGLHIVIENDKKIDFPFETLVIKTSDLKDIDYSTNAGSFEVIESYEEIQNYALFRLLRKTAEAKIIVENMNLEQSFATLIKNFLYRYFSKRHRPIYEKIDIEKFVKDFTESEMTVFLRNIQVGLNFNVSEQIFKLMKTKISTEGNHLRREIILNCLLPLSLAIANEEQRISLFVWFWSTPSLNSYGVLKRKFKNLPQNFLWQQQGLLEILQEYGKKSAGNTPKNLKIGEVLNFFVVGNPPFK
ncbi:MAG: DUF2851 family protein [Ignavibacteria bacterium]|nr:DUF2851 family protein [Ignavibacteria bacterium]